MSAIAPRATANDPRRVRTLGIGIMLRHHRTTTNSPRRHSACTISGRTIDASILPGRCHGRGFINRRRALVLQRRNDQGRRGPAPRPQPRSAREPSGDRLASSSLIFSYHDSDKRGVSRAVTPTMNRHERRNRRWRPLQEPAAATFYETPNQPWIDRKSRPLGAPALGMPGARRRPGELSNVQSPVRCKHRNNLRDPLGHRFGSLNALTPSEVILI
jgi:hypothetical protein